MTHAPGDPDPRQAPPIMPMPVPPQPYGGPPGWAPPPPRKKGMPAWAIVLVVVGGVIALFCGGGVILFAIGAGSAASAPKPTVHVTSCEYDGVIATYMNYTIKNNDSKPHDYYVSGTVGHSPALPDILKNVAPGETASGKLMGTEQGDCRITRVDQQ